MAGRTPPLGGEEATNEHLPLKVRVAETVLGNIDLVDFIANALTIVVGAPFVLSTPGEGASSECGAGK